MILDDKYATHKYVLFEAGSILGEACLYLERWDML